MPIWLQTAALLCVSNLFMTFAWYGHLKTLNTKPWLIAALISWGIALFEYLIMVPANRIGYTELSIGQLKIMQEVITLAIFVPFSVLYMHQPLKLDYTLGRIVPIGGGLFHISQLATHCKSPSRRNRGSACPKSFAPRGALPRLAPRQRCM